MMSQVRVVGECWEWQGTRSRPHGYGLIKSHYRQFKAHRIMWELWNNASVLPQFFVCHHCDNPICVNPAHLYVGTDQTNVDDKMARGRWAGGRKKGIPISREEWVKRFGR